MQKELDAGWILKTIHWPHVVVRSAHLSLAARNFLTKRVLISFTRRLCSFKVNTGKLALPMRPRYRLTCLLPTLFNPRIEFWCFNAAWKKMLDLQYIWLMPAYLVIYFGYLGFKKSIKSINVKPRDISVISCPYLHRCTLKELEPPHVSKANKIYWPKVIQLTE